MSSEKLNADYFYAGFVGFAAAAALGVVALPVCMWLEVHPAMWAIFALGMLPFGALYGVWWAIIDADIGHRVHFLDAPAGSPTSSQPGKSRNPWEGRNYRPLKSWENPTHEQ